MDIYLLLTNPNFFMWIAIVLGTSSYSDAADMMDMYTMFFGGFCYFVFFPIERRFVVKRFAEEIIKQSVSNMRMPKSEIEDLWRQIKHPDRDWLTVDDLAYVVMICVYVCVCVYVEFCIIIIIICTDTQFGSYVNRHRDGVRVHQSFRCWQGIFSL